MEKTYYKDTYYGIYYSEEWVWSIAPKYGNS